MDFLFDILKQDPEYERLSADLLSGNSPLAVSGLSQIHKSLIVSAFSSQTKRKIVVFTHDEASAVAMASDINAFGADAITLPLRDYNLTKFAGFSKDYEYRRIDTLSKLIDGDFSVLVLSVDSATQYTLPPALLADRKFVITAEDTIDIKELSEKLVMSGYQKSEICDSLGQFSVRGGIIDIFPVNRKAPVRIELWGDEIDSISEYDAISQRRTDAVNEFSVFPACELSYDADDLIDKLEKILKTDKKLTEKQTNSIEADIDALRNGFSVMTDDYISVLYEKPYTVFDYLPDALKIVCESGNMGDRLKVLESQRNEDIKQLLEDGVLSKNTADIFLSRGEFQKNISDAVYLESFPKNSYGIALKGLYNFDFKRISAWSGDINILKDDISFITGIKGRVVILAGEEKSAQILNEDLNGMGIKATYLSDFDNSVKSGVIVMKGSLSAGFEIPFAKFMLITHKTFSGNTDKKRKAPKNAKTIGSLDELKRGDYVVHTTHGIGIFDGINQITNNRITKDYIKIKYAGSDILYVPVTQLDLVSKYIGSSDDSGVKLNKLGNDAWNKTRSRVKSAVKNMAKQLTALYAKRMATKGYAFGPDTDLQNDFERRFEYEETDDQIRSVNEIKKDMERAVPMDRLLCGDVGFGKTEVALRAAFKCISEGKQCALLVPTTILAMQHFNTAMSRIGNLPVEIKLLNRYVSKKEQTKIISGLKHGTVDMVIGTHRLISKDVTFKDIGLVIIDEEQRFGVAQKEKLKELYPFVDILTLSATPIPRTLNMAMSGLRDMSSIDEAPGDRYPVQTYVIEQNDGLLVDAVNRELRRGGQVYYLHNHVDSIVRCASKLKEKIPEARIGIAHGQMGEDELSEVWRQLIDHEIDILVCTTIIETGVDVPNVNTLIIENSDRMGLSQLHQLRGRVGRSPRRAYAYFCFKQGKSINETAQKRLEAIREFTQFGSGFKIALRDLEIRGAGSILGGEQHGNMEAVGYDMYLKLLNDAVNEENGVEVSEEPECTVDLSISAHIPENYIDSLSSRLGIYKRIADIRDDNDVSDVLDELCDRFGEPPTAVLGLINVALLRNKASKAGIFEISSGNKTVILKTASIKEEVVVKLSDAFGSALTFATVGNTAYIIKLKDGETHTETVKRLATVL